ncbi:carbonic anhydrase 14 isoform X2 [Seriola aureovittata]|uniref:carbonic anhydrase n=2 Tax=Seriola lalandi dorsalis TaxID=1841481 RepID=A0A3B4XNM5_SERLL|nr:carbonic anhydrase 14 isoform X2 [Seriola aureovittata]
MPEWIQHVTSTVWLLNRAVAGGIAGPSQSPLLLSLSLSPSPSLSLSLSHLLLISLSTFIHFCVWTSRANMGLFILLMLLCFQWTAAPAADEITWTYTGLVGQSEWSAYFPDCRGTSQSPIDVVTTLTKYDPSLIPLTPLGYSQHGNKPFTLYNNGHTAVIELPEWMGLGGLPWLFTAVQMHLHWGSGGPSHGGSEHTINGLSADAELHVVHYNSELYPNMSAAMTQKDGLAVLGILIVTGEETNLAFNSILNYLSRIRHADQKVPIPAFDVQSLLPKDLGRYYRYNGSLTTPPCYQSVIWTVFHERVQISKAQLLKMETILYSSKADNPDRMLLQDNYRATQPLNHRVVFASFSAEAWKELSSGEVTAIVIGVMCGCVGLAVIIRFIVKTIRSTSSWDVLPSNRPAPMPRMKEPEKAKEKKQDMALNSTSEAEKKEEPSSPLQTEP